MRSVALLLICAFAVAAQAPVRVEFACTPEDVDSFGLGCSEEDPCPVFLDLSSIESVGGKLFLSGNLHTAATALFSVLLGSEDGGKTWTEPYKRLRAAVLEQIQFVDFANGWVGGQSIEPLAKDPFLLATADGGKTWRQRPLFDESRFGSIAQFWFDSPRDGELVFDRSQGGTTRHELYESMTGGDSWSVKEVNNAPILLKKATSKTAANWRIHADAASRTHQIQRRTGDGWETIASFLIHPADCK